MTVKELIRHLKESGAEGDTHVMIRTEQGPKHIDSIFVDLTKGEQMIRLSVKEEGKGIRNLQRQGGRDCAIGQR
jgi:hypothetical protein